MLHQALLFLEDMVVVAVVDLLGKMGLLLVEQELKLVMVVVDLRLDFKLIFYKGL